MKRLLMLAVVILFSFTLFSCKKDVSELEATLSNLDVGLVNMTFTITVEDPKKEITGEITLELFDEDDKLVHTKLIEDLKVLENYAISGLKNEMTYTLKLTVTTGRKSVVLIERDINLASAETVHIKTVDDFKAMVNNRAGNYVLDNDIDFAGDVYTTPFVSPFSGTFDGQGFALKNITFDKVIQYTGVFGYVSSGIVKNVMLDTVTIGTQENPLSMSTSSRVGLVAGYIASSNGRIENVRVINSAIHYTTSSTVQAYVGGLVGESRGNVINSSVDSTNIHVKSTSYGRIRVGGAIGMLGEESTLKEIQSHANIRVEMAGVSIKDRDLNINVGGVIGYHNARNVNRSVENLISSGDISITLDFGTIDGTTKGKYFLYVGGIAGIAFSNVNQALYSGSIRISHEKNNYEANVKKYFFVGGLYGSYTTSKLSEGNLRYSDRALIDLELSEDVILKASQLKAEYVSSAANVFSYFGELSLMVNDVDQTGSDVIDVITTFDGFFNSEFIQNYIAQYTN